MKSTDQSTRQQSPYIRRQQWPYHQTQKGGTPKPAGFWQDSRTQAILECYISTVITDSQASEILRASASDIKYHAKQTKKR
jgi:hypothetical protein